MSQRRFLVPLTNQFWLWRGDSVTTARYSNSSPAACRAIEWPIDDIRALGSEYTSRAWEDRLSPGWGDFVYEAYTNGKSAGIF